MLNRYIGNKKAILDPLMEVVTGLAEPGQMVCDIFSGTLAVSLELKRRGYAVASNDVNYFSAVYGRAFLTNDHLPDTPAEQLLGREARIELDRAARLARSRGDAERLLPDDTSGTFDAWVRLMAVLSWMERAPVDVVAGPDARTDIFDHYCEEGPKSQYVSSRGSSGRRRFFTTSNARRIDAILSRIRHWVTEDLIDMQTEATLLSALLDGVERVSNTQGTYHDFPRNAYDPRAFNDFQFVAPDFSGLCAGDGSTHLLGVAEDSLDFIERVPRHAAIYVDPPYNFRQYTAYYFMPNMLARYPHIADLDGYFEEIEYVRGQNMKDDFSSPFSRRTKFLEAMESLLDKAHTTHLVVSYFNGSNHWNKFKEEPADGEGYAAIKSMLAAVAGGPEPEVLPVSRLNYQSYGGHSAQQVDEWIFVATKGTASKEMPHVA